MRHGARVPSSSIILRRRAQYRRKYANMFNLVLHSVHSTSLLTDLVLAPRLRHRLIHCNCTVASSEIESRSPKPFSAPSTLAAAQPPSDPPFAFRMWPSSSPGSAITNSRCSRHQRIASGGPGTSVGGRHRTARALPLALPDYSPTRSRQPTQNWVLWR